MSYSAPGGSGTVLVTFATIAEAASNVHTAVNNINTQLDDLKSIVSKIAGTWEGEAAEAYQQKQAQWTSAQTDLTQVLQKIGTTLDTAVEAYQQTEKANTSSWS